MVELVEMLRSRCSKPEPAPKPSIVPCNMSSVCDVVVKIKKRMGWPL